MRFRVLAKISRSSTNATSIACPEDTKLIYQDAHETKVIDIGAVKRNSKFASNCVIRLPLFSGIVIQEPLGPDPGALYSSSLSCLGGEWTDEFGTFGSNETQATCLPKNRCR